MSKRLIWESEQNVRHALSSRNALSTLEQADRGHVLDVGHIIMTGPAQELLDNPRMREAYLGL